MRSLLLALLLPMTSPAAPKETQSRFEAPGGDALSYLLIEPDPAPLATNSKRPLVVFLHGSGERGDDLEKVKTHGPPKQALEGHGLPFVVLAPQCPAKKWWNLESVVALTKHIAAERNIDPKRIHLTGLSMGGYGTWAIIAKEPELFASAVPICGGGDPDTASIFKNLPIWAFHGERDDAVPVSKTRAMEKALTDAGAKQARFTYYPEAEHDSWTQTYNDPALYAWMMLQSK
ncbi:prolyl oligopeptidase family serine peptidase [Haloferula sp.]|uniref:carboxylesterase family protein n=1 Tax=Haloferula sp. TaxID=2497595 RepID=UPI00329D92F8